MCIYGVLNMYLCLLKLPKYALEICNTGFHIKERYLSNTKYPLKFKLVKKLIKSKICRHNVYYILKISVEKYVRELVYDTHITVVFTLLNSIKRIGYLNVRKLQFFVRNLLRTRNKFW